LGATERSKYPESVRRSCEVIVWSKLHGDRQRHFGFEALCAGVLAVAPQIGGASFLASYCVGKFYRGLSKKSKKSLRNWTVEGQGKETVRNDANLDPGEAGVMCDSLGSASGELSHRGLCSVRIVDDDVYYGDRNVEVCRDARGDTGGINTVLSLRCTPCTTPKSISTLGISRASVCFGKVRTLIARGPQKHLASSSTINVSVRVFDLPACLQAKTSSTFDKPLQLACRIPSKALRFT
jgi:hypothetical protein